MAVQADILLINCIKKVEKISSATLEARLCNIKKIPLDARDIFVDCKIKKKLVESTIFNYCQHIPLLHNNVI